MASPSPNSVVIACPQCGTRYQLPREALGKKRMVKCAHCATAWEALPVERIDPPPPAPVAAEPPPPETQAEDQIFTPAEERRMDMEFEAIDAAEAPAPSAERPLADIVASIAPKPKATPAPDIAVLTKTRQRAFVERQLSLNRRLPMARLRNAARQIGLAGLIIVLAVMLLFRTEIVRTFPDLAGAYEVMGLGVNVVGLEFREVKTLKSLRDGSEMLTVDARIVSVADQPVRVPPVIVTLLNAAGDSIYEWSASPEARDLEPGESISFKSQLTRPPEGAEGVRLTFIRGHVEAEATVTEDQPTAATENPA